MALKVRLNTNYPYGRFNISYYDVLSGINLALDNLESGDLTGLDISNVKKSIASGVLIVSEGTIPDETFLERMDRCISVFTGTNVGSGATITSSVVDIGGSLEKAWYIVTTRNMNASVQLSPNGTNWFTYFTEVVNTTDAVIGHATVGKKARLVVTNNSSSSGTVTAFLYARFV